MKLVLKIRWTSSKTDSTKKTNANKRNSNYIKKNNPYF